jgi:hypothetical protein
MALPKRVKIGGSYYKGYKLVVGAGAGDYVLDMTLASACVINGLTVIPDTYGTGDYFKLEHLNSGNVLVALLGETVYNVGANAAWQFDFATLENMNAGDKFRLTYTNVAGIALNVYTNLERIR